jgi:hypothetical protein
MAAQARMLAVELDELKGRAGSAWTSEKERAAEASAFQAPQARPKPYTYRWRTNPITTYRTLCVRLCDGFYFPLSSAARPAGFLDDEKVCRASCSVPAKLFLSGHPCRRRRRHGLADRRALCRPSQRVPLSQRIYIERCACKPRPWSAEAKAEYERRAILATRSRAGRMVASGASEMARLLAEADIEVAQRMPAVRAAAYRGPGSSNIPRAGGCSGGFARGVPA